MGLLVGIYRDAQLGDCTGGGISSTASGLCIVNVNGPFSPNDRHPAAMLTRGPGGPIVVPAEAWSVDDEDEGITRTEWQAVAPPGLVGPMFGGNIADTSDSRWAQAVRAIAGFVCPVRIHDRFETTEQYRLLSSD